MTKAQIHYQKLIKHRETTIAAATEGADDAAKPQCNVTVLTVEVLLTIQILSMEQQLTDCHVGP